MKKNFFYEHDPEVELIYLLKNYWEKKFLILFISILCGFLGCLFFFFLDIKLKTEITLNKPAPGIFFFFDRFTNEKNSERFFFEYDKNFLSNQNLIEFISQNAQFKAFFKTKNINPKKYINLTKNKETEFDATYKLIFPKEFEGTLLLNNYAQFIKNKTDLEFKQNLEITLNNRIRYLAMQAKNASSFDNEEFSKKQYDKTIMSKNSPNNFGKEYQFHFSELELVKNILANLENERFDYKLIDQSAIKKERVIQSIFIYFFSGLIFGLFFSLTFLFFKTTSKI